MSLEQLNISKTKIKDLELLKGMPLTHIECENTDINDLNPLKGMPLKMLCIDGAKVTDLTPLSGMKIGIFIFTPGNITKGIEIVRGMKSIRQIRMRKSSHLPPEEFWKKYDAGEFE